MSSNITYMFFLFRRSQLPARATRLLNRSRVQPSTIHSDSPRSLDSFAVARQKTSSGSSPRPSPHHHPHHHHHLAHHLLNASPIGGGPAAHSPASLTSSDDNLIMLDKSMRNTMIQDVHQLKKDLLRLRSVLFDVSETTRAFLCFLVFMFVWIFFSFFMCVYVV